MAKEVGSRQKAEGRGKAAIGLGYFWVGHCGSGPEALSKLEEKSGVWEPWRS